MIGGWDNRAFGDPKREIIATVVGGYRNTANGYHAMVTGGYQNVAWGRDTLVSGGRYNTVLGEMEDGWTDQHLSDASAFGGEGSVVQGLGSVGLAGGSTGKTAYLALAAGYQSVVTDGAAKLEANFSDYEILPVYKDIASAIGYQSTANEAGTISFGHDAGDVSGYTVNWEEDKDPTHDTIDYGSNDYTKTPTVTENYYDDAYYNRLVKVADGIDNHDAVTREQVQYIGGIYGTDKNDSNYGGRGATGTNSVAIGSNAVATEDNVVSFGNPDIPAVNIPESRKITHSVSLSDTDKTAINNVLGFDVTNDENWSKISGLKDLVIVNSLGSATDAQDRQKLANNPEFMELLNKVNTAILNGTLTSEQWISFEKYANGTEVETTDAVNIPAKAANYRRVVNMADGINPHDAVAMEQLEDYAKTDASNIGNSNENKDDWGEALGVDSLTTADAASNSNQLITGKTLYNYDKPNADGTYVKLNQTTGQNLSALDTQVKANTDALTKPNHNIKYYAVDETTLPKLTNFNGKDYSNEKNNGAKGMGSIAAGFNTHADGIASTVAGSYSGVINQNSAGLYDLRGATALSYGTFNINQNTDTDTGKIFSGVANSIVGQANATIDSNAAIIYGAGNTVINSYRGIDTPDTSDTSKFLSKVKQDIKNKDAAAVAKDLQQAVPTSGGQVMVMGGGNNVESAYMTQVVGVGNTVKGNQVYAKNAKTGEWNWTTDTNDKTAIKDYDPEKSSQYNYVDGFSNEVINGKHDYVIGANNKLSGDSYDNDKVLPIKRSNRSNIVIGDNHILTREQNTVIIGSIDTEDEQGTAQDTQTKARDAVIIGHNANATNNKDDNADNAVAIGRSAKAKGGNAVTIGVNTSAGAGSITIGSESWAISKNNIAIGRHAKVDGYNVTNAVALGWMAEAHATDGVAIGSESQATVKGDSVEGYDPATGNASEDTTATWKATKGAVSIGTADGTVTRQINGLAAGTKDTDAVNVAQLKKLNGMKANVDASNIGANLKGTDGKTAASDAEKTTNENAWGTAIGTGSITADNGQLVTGKTVYAYNKPVAAEGKTLNYISDTNTTGQNLTALDTQIKTNADNIGTNTTNISNNTENITNLKNLSNITEAGQTVIKNLAKGSIGMEDGSHTSVSHRDVNGVETYKVDVTVDGQVAENNTGIVNGGTVYSALQDVKNQTSADLANKANVDASNLTPDNVTKWQEKLGNGKVESGNTGLVTGDTVFKAVDTKANRDGSNLTDKEANSFSEKIARGEVKAGENRAVSGDAVSQAISKVTGDMNTKLDGKANTSLDNITDTGKNVIRDLAKGSVKVIDGTNTTVTTVEGKGEKPTTYAVNVEGKGTVTSDNTGLISGGTAYTELRPADGTYVKRSSTTAANLSALDTGLKNTSSLIHTNTSGDTIHIGETSKATKVDVSSTDVNGNKNGRVVTGVVTDAKDANSAANVGYVNGVTAANTQQIYRDMNNAYSHLDRNINRAAAGSNALAALHPLDYDPADKASFAVGFGHYHNANAAAIGAFYYPNANTMVNVGVSVGNGDPGINAGVSFKLGQGSAYNGVSKAEMAQTIHDQAAEISTIKANDAAKDKRIDALEKENQEMKKQIQEILARLNG